MSFINGIRTAGEYLSYALNRAGFMSALALAILLVVCAFIVELVINALSDGNVGIIAKKIKKFIAKEGAVDAGNGVRFGVNCGGRFSKNTRLLWNNYLNLKTDSSKRSFIASFVSPKVADKKGVYRGTALFCAAALLLDAAITRTPWAEAAVALVFPAVIYAVLLWVLTAAIKSFNKNCFKKIEYIVDTLSKSMDLNVIDAKRVARPAKSCVKAAEKALEKKPYATLDEKLETDGAIDYMDKISAQVDKLIGYSKSKETFVQVLTSLEAAYSHNYMRKENKERLGEIINRVKTAMAAL